jgi:N utilization substance protein B
MARSTARKRALNTLYEADEKGQDILSLLSERIENPGAQTPLPDYAIEIVKGVAAHRSHVDSVLNEHSSTWQVSRMPVVDRNILRIGAWEIIYNDEIPNKVAVDEALQLAKKLSDYDAPGFIHGLLSAVMDDPEVKPEPEVDEDAAKAEAGEAAETETKPEPETAAPPTATDGVEFSEIGLADFALPDEANDVTAESETTVETFDDDNESGRTHTADTAAQDDSDEDTAQATSVDDSLDSSDASSHTDSEVGE